MRVIVLCAGQGTRLRPLTDEKPKCMVELMGKPLLEHQFDALNAAGIDDITLVTGYAAERLEGWGRRQIHNPEYADTNMVWSLFCARDMFDGKSDLIVAYSDIVYESRVIDALLAAPDPVATVVDRDWLALWSMRMDDPLADAETLRLNADGTLREIGNKARSLSDCEGQYIGLTKISAAVQRSVLDHYEELDRGDVYDGRRFEQMFMTRFITSLIEAGYAARAAIINSGWLEVDTLEDLRRYEALAGRGELQRFWRPVATGK